MKKILKRICKIPIFILALPCVIVVRLLRPIVWIRFLPILPRIGHAAANVESYLLERRAGMHEPKAIDIFFPCYGSGANRQLVKMWARVIPVIEPVKWLAWANNKLPGGKVHFKDGAEGFDRDIYGLGDECGPLISFTPVEEKRGKELLNKMGIGNNPFVCFYTRDNVFLRHYYPDDDWSYHDYRDANIDHYTNAVNYLLDRGYYAVRMGKLVEKPFALVKNRIIDYPLSLWRSDFADLYLISRCRYFIGQGAGLEVVARLFRKPQVALNVIPLNLLVAWSKNYLIIFKKLWLKKEKRFMTFREILFSELSAAMDGEIYHRWDIEVVENTPEEIGDVVLEMEERLNGVWQNNDEYEHLQRQFWALFKPDRWNRVFRAQIGSKFLMQNRDLLK